MKKFLIFLSILAVLITPISSGAQEPVGNCTYPGAGTASGYTKTQCDNAGGSWTVSPTQPVEPRGNCTFPNAGSASGYTKTQCDTAGGTWSQSTSAPIAPNLGTDSPSSANSTTPSSTSSSASSGSTSFSGGLVECGKKVDADGKVTNPCGFTDLMKLINRVIDFVFKVLALPLAALMFAYAGFLMVTSGGSSEKATKAKHIFTSVALGLVLAAAAWLIVKTFLSIMGYHDVGLFFLN